MNQEWMTIKEEAILFAKEKIEDAAEAISEVLPEASEELNWFQNELTKELQSVRGEKLSLAECDVFSRESGI